MSEMEGTRRVQINNSALRMIYAMSFIVSKYPSHFDVEGHALRTNFEI